MEDSWWGVTLANSKGLSRRSPMPRLSLRAPSAPRRNYSWWIEQLGYFLNRSFVGFHGVTAGLMVLSWGLSLWWFDGDKKLMVISSILLDFPAIVRWFSQLTWSRYRAILLIKPWWHDPVWNMMLSCLVNNYSNIIIVLAVVLDIKIPSYEYPITTNIL